MLIVDTDISIKSWAIGKAMEFLYSSYETTLKDETKKVSVLFSSALTHSSDKTNRNSPLNNFQNSSTELDESPLLHVEAQSRKNSIISDNQKIPHLGGFNLTIAKQVEDKDITKAATMPFILP